MNELVITKPDNFHVHLRQGELMRDAVKEEAKVFQRVLAMPNLIPPVKVAADLKKYREELKAAESKLDYLMTFKIMPDSSPEMIPELKEAGAIAGKFYPLGVTTHSDDAVANIKDSYQIFEAMQSADLVLCIHGEVPWEDDLAAEAAFLPYLKDISENFPKLRIVLEHLTSKDAVEYVRDLPDRVSGGITIHHMYLTMHDLKTNGDMNPFYYVKPMPKKESDRQAIIRAVLSGDPKYFLGTDSAPHLRVDKESKDLKPGIYSTPVALPLLTQLFEEHNKLKLLENFTSKFGADFYQLPYNSGKLTLKKEDWVVPDEYFGVVPFKAGETLHWRIKSE